MDIPAHCATKVQGTQTRERLTAASPLNAPPALSSCDLPTEFFILLRYRIKADGCDAVAAKLSQVSRAFYDLFEPAIDYTHLSLDRGKAAKLFRGVQRDSDGEPLVTSTCPKGLLCPPKISCGGEKKGRRQR